MEAWKAKEFPCAGFTRCGIISPMKPIAALAFIAACLAMPQLPAAATAPKRMRVLTYNILFSGYKANPRKPDKNDVHRLWNDRKTDLAAFVRRIDPDVGGFQEACRDQVEFFKGEMPDFGFSGEYRGVDKDGTPLSGSPVFWRKSRFDAEKRGTFWLSPTPDVPGSYGWKSPGPRVCSWQILTDKTDGTSFCIANVHADHKSPESKLKSARLVVERIGKIAEKMPIVLIGDHNAHQTDAPAAFFAKTWRNTLYESETPPKGTWRSYNGWKVVEPEIQAADAIKAPLEERMRDKRKYGWRIDYIYVSGGVRVRSCETSPEMRPGLGLYYSDHFPVFADLLFGRADEPCARKLGF